MKDVSFRYVGDPDFHDGYIREVSHDDGILRVTVEGFSGKLYLVLFSRTQSIEQVSPTGMLLYALLEKDLPENDALFTSGHLYQYEFLNSVTRDEDDPETIRVLKFLADGLVVEVLS